MSSGSYSSLAEARHGYCATTSSGIWGDCLAGIKGSFGTLPEGILRQGPESALEFCVGRCRMCGRCRFVSVSVALNDCSWYRHCRFDALLRDTDGFWTAQVRRTGRSGHASGHGHAQGSTDLTPSDQWRHLGPSENLVHSVQWRKLRRALPRLPSPVAQSWCLVHQVFHFQRGGYYVDVGAASGLEPFSSTYALDRRFNWSGLCIEPQGRYRHGLAVHRTCTLAQTALHASGKRETFLHAPTYAEQSGLAMGLAGPRLLVAGPLGVAPPQGGINASSRDLRALGWRAEVVRTTTLATLLRVANAPRMVDFVRLDCSGCEEDAMQAFPWPRYQVRAVTVQTPGPKLHALLVARGLCAAVNFFAPPHVALLYLSATFARGLDLSPCGATANQLPEYVKQQDRCSFRPPRDAARMPPAPRKVLWGARPLGSASRPSRG
jgi:hypothetical protein